MKVAVLVGLLFVVVAVTAMSGSCSDKVHSQPCFDPKVLRCRNHGRFAPTAMCAGIHGTTPRADLPRCFNMTGSDPFSLKYWNVYTCPGGDCTNRQHHGTVPEKLYEYALWSDGLWSVTKADTSAAGVVWLSFANLPGYPQKSTQYYISVMDTAGKSGWSAHSHSVPVSYCLTD
eukprot:TRINITY_DN112670_c0_g1_i1.p1 TRINITY_DN112670_c0_g1~~TRINITY_DN112670_c0_g1_i1.p1  ORF type:complete len:174 (-),score=14.97 TRINITY_DN112670_c0_g1_i1:92-613(-)